jgi:uncharacterized protein YfiM (DUF2279 family)
MADMDALMGIAGARNLSVIEDCAHAHGAIYKGRAAGAIGHLGSFSFQSSKVMSAGEGGAVIGRDKALHFSATFVIAGGGYGATALFTPDRSLRLGVGAGLGLAAGAAKEIFDMTGRGTPSWRDFAWDAVGTATGVGLTWLIDRYVLGRRRELAFSGAGSF